jgi:hypothetical protein
VFQKSISPGERYCENQLDCIKVMQYKMEAKDTSVRNLEGTSFSSEGCEWVIEQGLTFEFVLYVV